MDYYNSLSARKQRFLRRSLQMSDLVLCLSDVLKEACEASIGVDHCAALNNCVDTDKYGRIHEQNQNVPHQLLFLGRVLPHKGVYDLLEVLRRLKEDGKPVRCIIAGDGETDKIRALAASYGLQELCLEMGRKNYEKARSRYSSSKLLEDLYHHYCRTAGNYNP